MEPADLELDADGDGAGAVAVLESLVKAANDITQISDFRRSHKRACLNLSRRVKLMLPFFEELREATAPPPQLAVPVLAALDKALLAVKQLLQFCRDGSKLYLVLESESIAERFHKVTEDMDKAFDEMPWDLLEVSDEVREQVELVHCQIKRAKGRADTQDVELFVDVMLVLSQKDERTVDAAILHRLADKLQLKTSAELRVEARALQRLAKERGPESEDSVEQMSLLLRRLRNLTDTENSESETLDLETLSLSAVACADRPGSPVVPNDFRCPITLEMMKDPVIVATGQTYERTSIQKWLEGHKTCPKTRQVLQHTALTPNYVLRSLIAQWCEANGIEVPKRSALGVGGKPNSADISSKDRSAIDVLIQHLCSGQLDLHRAAAGELRSLAKQNNENRICIAEAGAIPHLVGLLASQDARTQEHAVTALLNLSIHEANKAAIVQAGAISPIVGVLRHGSMEARENAAATLFSLSVVDENKMTIGASGAIPALVDLLRDGNPRGRKDAATALFNLSIYQGNKPRAVRAGVVEPLMRLLVDPSAGMVDEALAILAILATHQEGRVAIGNAGAVPVLVDLISTSSPRNKENAAAVLLALSISDPAHLITAQQLGAEGALIELSESGTARARRKACSLLEHFSRQELQLQGCVQ